MWVLSRYWKEAVIALSIGAIVWYVMSLRNEIIELSGKNEILQGVLLHQSEMIEAHRAEYEASLSKYKEKEKEVTTKWKTRYETIYVWEDKNVSCENAMARFNSTVY